VFILQFLFVIYVKCVAKEAPSNERGSSACEEVG
jgi:hypothetical protein